MTGIAAENIAPVRTGYWAQGGGNAIIYPANGTKVVSPELDRKLCRSLKRTARLLSFRLYCRLLLLDVRKLLIEAGNFGVSMFRNLLSGAFHFICNASHGSISDDE
jgi:hypothetical protein